MTKGITTIKFRSSVNRIRGPSGRSIINGYHILRELGSGTESSVRLGQSLQSGTQVSVYFQPLTDSRKGFTGYNGRFNYFQLLDKINVHAIPGTRRVLEIWYNKNSCIQLHKLLVCAGVTFIDSLYDTTAPLGDTDSTIARTLFLVVEYCSNSGIQPIVGQLHYSDYISFSRRLSYTIYSLHKIGIIHKDIKVDNILFNEKHLRHNELFYAEEHPLSVDPYLIDFGISIDLSLLNTKIITFDTMLQGIGRLLTKDLGQVTTLEWFDIEGPVYAILTKNERVERLIEIVMYYIKHFFTIESLRILADPLISSNEKFITNKNGTIAYLPPELSCEDLHTSICDRPGSTIKTHEQATCALAEVSVLPRCSTHPRCNSFKFNRDTRSCNLCTRHETSSHEEDALESDHMVSQATLIKSTITLSTTAKESSKEFSSTFRKISASNSFYAILPSPVDVWCFGVTILYIMIGAARTEPLYRRSNDVLAISQHLTPFTTDLLCGCLALDPVERYTAEDISRHPLYVGYRVSYEEDNLTTYVSSIAEYRRLFGLPPCSEEGFADEAKAPIEDDLEQTTGNALENYHQYIVRTRRKTIISNNKKHIRRASLSSLESVFHEHIFKDVYTDDTILMALKLHNSDVLADPWISSVLLQLDLTAISLQVRNSMVRYLHPQDSPNSRSYLVPKFFDLAHTLGKSQSISQGLLSMRLKSLTYLATRLLETTVYHNSYTDFKKQIMPEHVRGYTHCGSLVPWVAGASADGQEWARYRRCWGTRASEQGSICTELFLFSSERLSTLTLSSSESSSPSIDNINQITLEFSSQGGMSFAGTPIEPSYYHLARNQLQSLPKDVSIFGVQSTLQAELSYRDVTEDEISSSQCKITEESILTAQPTTTYTADTTFVSETPGTFHESHDTSHDLFPLGLATPSEHHIMDPKMFATQIVQPPSCDLLSHNLQLLDKTLVSHKVVAGHHHTNNSLRRFKDTPFKSSNLISVVKLTTAKPPSTGSYQCSQYPLSKEPPDKHTTNESAHKRYKRSNLLLASTARTLRMHKSYTANYPTYDNCQITTDTSTLCREQPGGFQIQREQPQHTDALESKSTQSTSVSLNIHIGGNELVSFQSPCVHQIGNISMHSSFESTDVDDAVPYKLRSNIFNSNTKLPDIKVATEANTRMRSSLEDPNSLIKTRLWDKKKMEENSNATAFALHHNAKHPSLSALSTTRTLRYQLRNAIGTKADHTLEVCGKVANAVVPITAKRVQFHCQRRYALFKKSLPKKHNPPLKVSVVLKASTIDEQSQDGQQPFCHQNPASTSSSILMVRPITNTAISLQTSDSTTTTASTDVKSVQLQTQSKVSSSLRKSLLTSSVNCETFDVDTSTTTDFEIAGYNAASGIERDSLVPISSDINASPAIVSSGAYTSVLTYDTPVHELNDKSTHTKMTSTLSHDNSLVETTGDEEPANIDPSTLSQTEPRSLNYPKSSSKPVLLNFPNVQPTIADSVDVHEANPAYSVGIPPKHVHQLHHCQHARSMLQLEVQKDKQLQDGTDLNIMPNSDSNHQGNRSTVLVPTELADRSIRFSMQCTHKHFVNVLKRRSRGSNLAQFLFKELEVQYPMESQLLAPKHFDLSTKIFQDTTTSEETFSSSNQDDSPMPLPNFLFRSRTLNALIDLSDIESFDDPHLTKCFSAQKTKRLSSALQSKDSALKDRRASNFSGNIFASKWLHNNVTTIPTLPLVSTRNLGIIEKTFIAEGAGSLDGSKLIRINRYDANNSNLKEAASYLRNACTSNITEQDTNRLRPFTYEVSDTNNDEASNEKPATSTELCTLPSCQSTGANDNVKCFEDNPQLNASKMLDANQRHSIDISVDILDSCETSDKKTIGVDELMIQAISPGNLVEPIDFHRNGSLLLPDSVLSAGYTPQTGDEAISFMNQQTPHGLEASTVSYIAKDSINNDVCCLTVAEDNEEFLSKSDEPYTPTKEKQEKKRLPVALSNKLGQGDVWKKCAQISAISCIDSQSILETKWRIPDTNPKNIGDTRIVLPTVTSSPLAKYVQGLPRFLNRFFPFSFTQSLFSSAANAPYRLSGLFFAHYYTYMLPHVIEPLDMFAKHDLMEVSREYELSLSVDSAQETVFVPGINNPAPKALVGSCRTMSNNKVLRSAEAAVKKPPARTLNNLKLTDFSELFNDVNADEETHILELEAKDSQYEGSEFLMEDYDSGV
ncbi:Kinase [Giardia duodenalis]|uniref:Kinase n=1 Tax=Giardia intestinalis (strain ATCC 50803 / WB clone C6) TaxID=184922 RepID=A8B8B7_GIAIC|nr:Kinase [Giardia intestinalis]KAE8305310.1 Kinase [Giardia intestinalis]|eukprot:XP_001708986.1 Kinase [Giardia lamblia ATCC 50803]